MKKALKDFESKDFGKIKKGTDIPDIVLNKMDIMSLEAAGFIEKDKKETTAKKVVKK